MFIQHAKLYIIYNTLDIISDQSVYVTSVR